MTAFEKIEATTKRLEILGILTRFLLMVAKREKTTDAKSSNLLKAVYLCINRVGTTVWRRLTMSAMPRLRRHRARYWRVAARQGYR